MQKDDKKNDLVEYRIGKFTVLQLMAGLAILGVVIVVVGRWLLGSSA